MVSIFSPIWKNHNFSPTSLDASFLTWYEKGIRSLYNLFSEGRFISFPDWAVTYDLPKSNFFRYLQIKKFVQKCFSSFPDLPDNKLDNLLSKSMMGKKLISTLYNFICEINPSSLENIKKNWESDLDQVINNDTWEAALRQIHVSSICARHGLIQLKIVLRAHLTNARLAKMYTYADPSCPRCKGQPADHIHMLWSCPALSTYWSNIFDAYTKMFKKTVSPEPLCAIFGITPTTSSIAGKARDVIAFTSLIARRNILLNWKQQSPRSFTK